MFIIENQLTLLILFFLTGCCGTAYLLRKRAGHRAWLMADLIWVVLGGFGALGAVLAGVYKADSSQINRQIDVAYAASSAFDRDAARFRLGYCEGAKGVQVAVLCDKADFLSASTADHAELPLFLAITSEVAPLRSLNFFGSDSADHEMMQMADKADAFDPDNLLVFNARDAQTDAALSALRQTAPRIAAEFNILASSYETLVAQVSTLKEEWEYLQDNAFILLIQIIAICLVSFAAPFRLGKSFVDIRDYR